jgi:hypothetical protein
VFLSQNWELKKRRFSAIKWETKKGGQSAQFFLGKSMKFYHIADEYIEFLKSYDSKVPENKNESRPYVGVVLEIPSGELQVEPVALCLPVGPCRCRKPHQQGEYHNCFLHVHLIINAWGLQIYAFFRSCRCFAPSINIL